MGKIEVQQRTHYGETRFYPANDTAALLAELLGTRTLTRQALRQVTRLGFSVEVQVPQPERFDIYAEVTA